MATENLGFFRIAGEQMAWLSQRQKLTSQNIANSNTPGYMPSDLQPINFDEVLRGMRRSPVTPDQTNVSHLRGTKEPELFSSETEGKRQVYELAPDENGITLEEQMIRMNETTAKYQLAANLVTKNLKMLKMAVSRN